MKDVSVNRKGSSLRDGHGVDKRDSAEESRILWRGKEEEEEEEEERESSRDSANSSTNGSEKEACARTETAVGVVLLFENDFGLEDRFGISDKRLRTVAVAISSSLFLQRSNQFSSRMVSLVCSFCVYSFNHCLIWAYFIDPFEVLPAHFSFCFLLFPFLNSRDFFTFLSVYINNY